jgi:hypothetical protein
MYAKVRLVLEMAQNYNQSKEVPMGGRPLERKNDPRNLRRVALVTGARRHGGRARRARRNYLRDWPQRGQATTDNLPGAIEESAVEVTRRSGQGVALRLRSRERARGKVFPPGGSRRARQTRHPVNAWGGYEAECLMPAYFWQAPLRLWEAMFERGLKAHLLAPYFAIPLMIESATAPLSENEGESMASDKEVGEQV